VFDSWIGDLTDKVTAGVIEKLWAIFLSMLHGIGFGTILIGIGLLLVLILILKLLSNSKVLVVLAALCLIIGYCQTKGVDFNAVHRYLADSSAASVSTLSGK
jgi:hypothetical protein